MQRSHSSLDDGAMWTGKAIIQPGWAIFFGTAGDHVPHRHHAVQLVVGLTGTVGLWSEKSGELEGAGAVIAADHAHRLTGGRDPLLLAYVNRETDLGRQLDAWCGAGARALSTGQAEHLRGLLRQPECVTAQTLKRVVAIILDSAAASGTPPFHDPRIAQLLATLPRPLPERISTSELAARVSLSPGRFGHLFRAHTGMPLRPYLRWLRLQQALASVAQGYRLTEAAHAAGFADSAHLSRSFRRTFGIPPQVLLNPAFSLKTGLE